MRVIELIGTMVGYNRWQRRSVPQYTRSPIHLSRWQIDTVVSMLLLLSTLLLSCSGPRVWAIIWIVQSPWDHGCDTVMFWFVLVLVMAIFDGGWKMPWRWHGHGGHRSKSPCTNNNYQWVTILPIENMILMMTIRDVRICDAGVSGSYFCGWECHMFPRSYLCSTNSLLLVEYCGGRSNPLGIGHYIISASTTLVWWFAVCRRRRWHGCFCSFSLSSLYLIA